MESNRTWLSSVVFLDIVGYSKCSVARQIAMKDRMNEVIADAMSEVAERDRVVVDAGDGAALCFLGDPEDALFSAVKIRDAFTQPGARPDYDVRIGINLGPVKVVRDINDRANVLGDGINVAQRVMAFANENQILVSRSFFEVISCLSQEYAELFHYRGVHKDKHVREHAIYEVSLPSETLSLDVSATDPVDLDTGPSTSVEAAQVSATERAPARAPAATVSHTRTPEVLSDIERVLAEHVGPLAKVLVKKAHGNFPGDDAFMQELVDTISGEKAKRSFLRKLKQYGLRSDQPGLDVPSGPVTGPTAMQFEEEELTRLEVKLAEFVGPLAKVLVKKAARNAASREELHRALAAEIDGDREQRRFLRSVA